MNRTLIIAALLTLGSMSVLQAVSLPQGKAEYSVLLAAVPDPDLVGKKVNVIARLLSNDSSVSSEKIVLTDVLLLSIPNNDSTASDRTATLALSPAEIKKLDKMSGRVGVDILIQGR